MYFDRDDVALPNFSSFFLERSAKEREQAEKLLEYQNMRGGRILLQNISVRPKCYGCPFKDVVEMGVFVGAHYFFFFSSSSSNKVSTFCSRNQVKKTGRAVWMQ